MKGKSLRRTLALITACALAVGGAVPAFAARRYDDLEAITSHVELAVPQKLAICSPPGDLSTTAEGYYLTGTSNPSGPLTLNGAEVPGRGIYGSFGVFVPLYEGENQFTVKQGGEAHSVTITRDKPGTAAPIDSLQSLYPALDSPYRAGEEITFSCTAPAGATVWVTFGDAKIELVQVTDTQLPGAPAKFKASTTVGGVKEARILGPVDYGMTYNGETKTTASQGRLFLYPQGSVVNVRVADTNATVFTDSDSKSIATVVKGGAVDFVTQQTDEMLLLGMGGWIPKSSVTPLLTGSAENVIAGAAFSKTSYGERIKLTGTANPIATTSQADNILTVELHHTSGLKEVPLPDSRLFSDVTWRAEGDSTILEFTIAAGQTLWGHTVEYADNVTTLYCKYPPVKTGGEEKPLADIIVGLDAGHGGTDPGALGTSRMTGPVEKDITYATALAVQKRLESLGAQVILTTYNQGAKSSPSDRMQAATDGKADFYLSLHCNSVAGDGTKPNGVEIYYYYNRSKPFADKLLRNIVAETGRTDRGVKSSSFRVTMNSLTPAVLIEMGFISNAQEYDRLCAKEGIFQMANAVGNSIVEMLS